MGRRLEAFRGVLETAVARRGVALMGVCNVTPDSFSDGGRYLGVDAARARVQELLEEGADLVDIGGESTRPGAKPVPVAEQLSRILDVVRFAAGRGACVSVDTASPEVAAASLDAGACVVNDVSCLRDPDLARVAAGSGAALLLMHSRPGQDAMPGFSQYPDDGYGDVVDDVIREWEEAATRAVQLGMTRDALVMDPGLGFSKNARHSLELLARTAEIRAHLAGPSRPVPLAIGASRKSFLAVVDRNAPPTSRIGASIMAAVHATQAGASIVRVHDVRATAQAVDLARRLAVSGAASPPLRAVFAGKGP
jgi:dihydropteroate synthase